MNKNIKYIILTSVVLVLLTFLYWYMQGAETFTMTQVLVDKSTDLDRLLGVEHKEYVNQFIFGLLPSSMTSIKEMISAFSITGLIGLISGILIYLEKRKK